MILIIEIYSSFSFAMFVKTRANLTTHSLHFLSAIKFFECFQFVDQGFVLVLQNSHSVLQTLYVFFLLSSTFSCCFSILVQSQFVFSSSLVFACVIRRVCTLGHNCVCNTSFYLIVQKISNIIYNIHFKYGELQFVILCDKTAEVTKTKREFDIRYQLILKIKVFLIQNVLVLKSETGNSNPNCITFNCSLFLLKLVYKTSK